MPALIPIENLHRTQTYMNYNITENGVGTPGSGASFQEISQRWLKALLNNDIETVENIINNCNEGDKNRLINGIFRFQEDIQSYLVQGIDLKPFAVCPLTRPWCIAAVVGAHKVMDLLLRNGVDARQYDENMNNVVHSLIYIAFLNPDLEEQLTNTYLYLKKAVSVERMQDLLMSENSYSFRPLELAAQLGTFKLFPAIFETEGVYLTRREAHGVYTIEWFDITVYESVGNNSRRNRSPLLSLMLLNRQKLTQPSTDKLFRSNIIQAWVATKIRSNYIFLLIWFMMRMVFLMSFVVFDLSGSWLQSSKLFEGMGKGNFTQPKACPGTDMFISMPQWAIDGIGIYLLVQSLISVSFYIVWIVAYIYQRFKIHMYITPTGYKRLLISRDFYIFCQFLLYTGILFTITVIMVKRFTTFEFPQTMVSFIYIETWVGLVWSVMFFAQMLPWIGHFVIAVQRMVTDLLKFLLVYSIFMAAFSIAFARLISPGKDGKCPVEYATYDVTVYTTIITMLNMVDYRKFMVNDALGMRTLHVVYTFMVAVMLLNFLIALFSNSVSYVYNNRRVIETVQRLSVIFMLEDFLIRLCPRLKTFAIRHYFSWEDERIYLNRVVIHNNTCNST